MNSMIAKIALSTSIVFLVFLVIVLLITVIPESFPQGEREKFRRSMIQEVILSIIGLLLSSVAVGLYWKWASFLLSSIVLL